MPGAPPTSPLSMTCTHHPACLLSMTCMHPAVYTADITARSPWPFHRVPQTLQRGTDSRFLLCNRQRVRGWLGGRERHHREGGKELRCRREGRVCTGWRVVARNRFHQPRSQVGVEQRALCLAMARQISLLFFSRTIIYVYLKVIRNFVGFFFSSVVILNVKKKKMCRSS